LRALASIGGHTSEVFPMRRVVALLLVLVASESHAGLYSDDMARCLVASTSQEDKTNLVRWVFAIASLHPKVADVSAMTPPMRDETDRKTAALFERLVTVDCREQARDAIRYEGPAAFQASFEVLGQVAMTELMAHEDIVAGFESFTKYLDESKFAALQE
jgi:hypothetical protein